MRALGSRVGGPATVSGSKSWPTAQAASGPAAETAASVRFRRYAAGMKTSLHVLPSQCAVKGSDTPCALLRASPTAQASLAERAVTSRSAADRAAKLFVITTGWTLQKPPLHCRISGAFSPLGSCSRPTTHGSPVGATSTAASVRPPPRCARSGGGSATHEDLSQRTTSGAPSVVPAALHSRPTAQTFVPSSTSIAVRAFGLPVSGAGTATQFSQTGSGTAAVVELAVRPAIRKAAVSVIVL